MRPVLDGNCTFCFGVLQSPIYVIDENFLNHLCFLYPLLDENLVHRSSICQTCGENVIEAHSFKNSYLHTNKPATVKTKEIETTLKKEESEVLICEICKTLVPDCALLSELLEEEQLSEVVNSLILTENVLVCSACQNSLRNLGNVITLLAVYKLPEKVETVDNLNVSINQLRNSKKEKSDTVYNKIDSKSPCSSSTYLTSITIDEEDSEGDSDIVYIGQECSSSSFSSSETDETLDDDDDDDDDDECSFEKDDGQTTKKRKIYKKGQTTKKRKIYKKRQTTKKKKIHQKSHSLCSLKKESFNCKYCDFTFDRSEYFKCHMMIHKVIREQKIAPELAKELLSKKKLKA